MPRSQSGRTQHSGDLSNVIILSSRLREITGWNLARSWPNIGAEKELLPAKLRDLNFEVLIALTARLTAHGLITSNRSDFQLICNYGKFQLEIC